MNQRAGGVSNSEEEGNEGSSPHGWQTEHREFAKAVIAIKHTRLQRGFLLFSVKFT